MLFRKPGAGLQLALAVAGILVSSVFGLAIGLADPGGAIALLLLAAAIFAIAWAYLRRGGRAVSGWHGASNPEPAPSATPARRKPIILVSDDEPAIADTMVTILNHYGYDASAVYTGLGEVERARQIRPDLVLTDIIKPDLNGIESAICIRRLLPQCKIVLMSGAPSAADLLADARARGYTFEVLAKPIHPQDLLEKLRTEYLPDQPPAP